VIDKVPSLNLGMRAAISSASKSLGRAAEYFKLAWDQGDPSPSHRVLF
jgi:hypothetical protein